jgi:hypothetical protein
MEPAALLERFSELTAIIQSLADEELAVKSYNEKLDGLRSVSYKGGAIDMRGFELVKEELTGLDGLDLQLEKTMPSGEKQTVNVREVAKIGQFNMTTGEGPNTLEAFRALLVDEQVLEDKQFRQLCDSIDSANKEAPAAKLSRYLKRSTENVEPVKSKNAKDLQDKQPKIAEKLKRWAAGLGAGAAAVGTFVAANWQVGVAAVGLAAVLEKVQEHQNKMNGCWLVDSAISAKVDFANASKCKIEPLTCDPELNKPQEDVTQCTLCGTKETNLRPLKNCGVGEHIFNLVTSIEAKEAQKEFPGTYDKNTSTFSNVLQQLTKNEYCPQKQSCSAYCRSERYSMRWNQQLKCVNCGTGCAANDLCGGCLSLGPDSLWARMGKTILIAIAGLCGVILLFAIAKHLFEKEIL